MQLWLGVFFNPNHDSIIFKKTAEEKLQMLETASKLPTTMKGDDEMTQVYQKLWEANGDGDENRKLHQIRVFRFVLAAKEPLTCQQVLEAVRFDPEAPEEHNEEIDMTYLRKLYHNFLREGRRVLEFEHVSAKTFILEMQDMGSKKSLFADQLQNHSTVAETSLLLIRNPDHMLWKTTRLYGNVTFHEFFDRPGRFAGFDDFGAPYKDRFNRSHELVKFQKLRAPEQSETFDARRELQRLHYNKRNDLAFYVLLFWSHHCHEILDDGVDNEEKAPMTNFLEHYSEELVVWIMERFEVEYHGVTQVMHRPIWHVAVRRGFKCVIRLLLDRGASIDGVDCEDGTALGVAAGEGDEDMALFLIEQGANVNATWGMYGTPLGAAVHHKKENMFPFFLRHGVDLDRAIRFSPDSDNEQWDSVGDKFEEVAEILQHYGRRRAILGADESAGDLENDQ